MLSGFTALLRDLRDADNARTAERERAHEADVATKAFIHDIRYGNRWIIKALGAMTEDMADMSRRAAATAREMNLRRKAEGRQRLAALIAEVDVSIAAGLITGEQGARLDAAIARAAEGLRE
jgi:hypothetical protein